MTRVKERAHEKPTNVIRSLRCWYTQLHLLWRQANHAYRLKHRTHVCRYFEYHSRRHNREEEKTQSNRWNRTNTLRHRPYTYIRAYTCTRQEESFVVAKYTINNERFQKNSVLRANTFYIGFFVVCGCFFLSVLHHHQKFSVWQQSERAKEEKKCRCCWRIGRKNCVFRM